MEISLVNIGKRFQGEWIFRGIHRDFETSVHCAILGGNGSGKSTLLQIVSGYLTPGEGHIKWSREGVEVPQDEVFKHISISTPFLNLYDDLTLSENISFFLQFKKFRNGITATDFMSLIELDKQRDKQLVHYSSGMRQRVKLGLAILADTSLLLLDEPTSHLDAHAVKWYQNLLTDNAEKRSIFIASNSDQKEIFLCNSSLLIEEFKK